MKLLAFIVVSLIAIALTAMRKMKGRQQLHLLESGKMNTPDKKDGFWG